MATYYVDGTRPDDSGDGLSEATAKKTIAAGVALLAAGDTLYIKASTTYSLTSPVVIGAAISANPTTGPTLIQGYGTTPGDGARATITSATNGVNLFDVRGGGTVLQALALTHTAATRGIGITSTTNNVHHLTVRDCVFDGCSCAIDGNFVTNYLYSNIAVIDCEIRNGTAAGLKLAHGFIVGCYVHDNAGDGIVAGPYNSAPTALVVASSVIARNAAYGIRQPADSSVPRYLVVLHSVLEGKTASNDGIYLNTASQMNGLILYNSVILNFTGFGINAPGKPVPLIQVHNAFYNNAAGSRAATVAAGVGDLFLGGNPFVNPAGGDYALNNTANAGTLLRGAGWPGGSKFGVGQGDIGPLRHPDPSGGSGSPARIGSSLLQFPGRAFMYKPNDAIAEEFVTSSSTGAAVNADSTPTAVLVRNGSDDGTVALTVTNVDAGRYKVTGTIPATYAAGDKLQIAVAATIGGTTAKGILSLGVLDAKRNADLNDFNPAAATVSANVTQWRGTDVLVPQQAGVPIVDIGFVVGQAASTTSGPIDANVVQWNSVPVAPSDTPGFPKVTVKSGTGTGELLLASGQLTIGTNNDKTGYALTQAFPANFAALVIDAAGRVDLGKWLGAAPNPLIAGRLDANAQAVGDKTGYSLAASQTFSTTGTVGGVAGPVTVGTNNDKTGYALTQAFPANFAALAIDAAGRVDLGKWLGAAPNPLIAGRLDANAQAVGDKTGYSLAPSGLDAIAVTDPGAPANHTTLPRMLVALWRRAFQKTRLSPTQFQMFANDGTTVTSTQAVVNDGTNFTMEAAQ
jgi:hypothetical protein